MTESSTAERSKSCEVGAQADVVEFVHGLGGPVIVTAYAADGAQVGYLMANEISDDEVEVWVVPGTVARLVAVPEEGEDPQAAN